MSIIIFLILNAVIRQDSIYALISAICGITYTVFAGKGKPFCYIFGILGSSFYCYLSFINNLWGNLILYALYYIPMQIIGYFQWNKNLNSKKNEIIKIRLKKKEISLITAILFIITFITYHILLHYNDTHPILDSITTVFSIGGMYLTVKRAIEQWIFWFFVNILSFTMWINIILNGGNVHSTAIMWFVYTILAMYFYIEWKRDLKI